jgi:hypothetical protein
LIVEMQEIKTEQRETWRESVMHKYMMAIWVSHVLHSSPFGFYELQILDILTTFEEYGLAKSVEPVIDVLWKISYPILPLITPYYNKYSNKDISNDWRKVLENNPLSNYKPKTKQLPFDQ